MKKEAFLVIVSFSAACSNTSQDPANNSDTGTEPDLQQRMDANNTVDTRPTDQGRSDVGQTDDGNNVPDFGDRPDLGSGTSGSVVFRLNEIDQTEYGLLREIPPEFGVAEFTLDFWMKPDASFPFGPTGATSLENWATEDPEPYENGSWWYPGNFLIDGHNNNSFDLGTFSVQFYGSGRMRWHLSDGDTPSGGTWVAQPWPATQGRNLVDDQWHKVALVRRFVGNSESEMELWIDGERVSTETMNTRKNFQDYWNGWPDFREIERGWFFGAEKQAAYGGLSFYEDYKGNFSQLRFWNRARTTEELSAEWLNETTGGEPGLVGYFPFDEGAGSQACDRLNAARCINFFRTDDATLWREEGPPTMTAD